MKKFHSKLETQKACFGNVNVKHFSLSEVKDFVSAFIKPKVLFQKKLATTFRKPVFSHFSPKLS